MKEYDVRLQVLASDLKPNEKVVMFAILMKVDWNTFKGQVSVSQIVEMTNSSTPTVKRILSQLTKKKWIKRTSRYIERERSTAAFTEILFDNMGIKSDTGVKSDTSVKTDTPTVSSMTPPRIKTDTVEGIKTDTHTISNNINSINNNIEETETHDSSEVDQFCIDGGDMDDFWLYPSSIQDPVIRRQTELYIQSHPHLDYSERQRLLFPDLANPFFKQH